MSEHRRAANVDKIVSTPQLFPTPPALAQRVIEQAEIAPGMMVLEPSAGTGNLIQAIPEGIDVVAYEISRMLCNLLQTKFKEVAVFQGDFLDIFPEAEYDRVVMNPPFVNGADIEHVKHALKFLRPGGRLVAICANGPRQQAQLGPLTTRWEDLPEGSFKQTALITIEV